MAMINWTEKKVSTKNLVPYERNPRRISRDLFEKLKESIKLNGYHQRIIVTQDLRVIGGHQRIKALTELGINEVNVLVPDRELTGDDFRRLLIQDNLSFGEFDFDIISSDFDIDELISWGMPEGMLGDFSKTGGIEGLTDPEEIPNPPTDPVSKLGDVWVMGNHRIICGDSTCADVVDKVLSGVRPHLMVTDPPYGVEYDAEKARVGSGAKGKVLNDDRSDWSDAWSLFSGNIAYIWHADRHCGTVFDSLLKNGFKVRAQIIWAKSSLVFSRGDYHSQHEPCFYAVKGTGNWTGDRKQTTLWQIDKPKKSETGHSTQKPVECMRRPMENNSSVGQAIYDPFSGSGTTIIAGEQIGRHVYAIELNPSYVDVAVVRWQNFTGKEAIHEETGKTYNEIKNGVG